MKSLYMESTEIEATRTQAELQALLSASGANEIRSKFENGQLVGLAFAIEMEGHPVAFVLPCRWKPIFDFLRRKKPGTPEDRLKEQALRVAWRQLLRWTQAQLALCETGMTKVQEVFLPYLQNRKGETLYELMEGQKFKMLEGPRA